MKSCCNINKKTKKCIRKKDKKVFSLPRRFSKKKCTSRKIRGYSMRSSCAPFKNCKKTQKGGSVIIDCNNEKDIVTDVDINLIKDDLIKFKPPNSGKFNCYDKETLERHINTKIKANVKLEEIKDPLSNTALGKEFINTHFPDIVKEYDEKQRNRDDDLANLSDEQLAALIFNNGLRLNQLNIDRNNDSDDDSNYSDDELADLSDEQLTALSFYNGLRLNQPNIDRNNNKIDNTIDADVRPSNEAIVAWYSNNYGPNSNTSSGGKKTRKNSTNKNRLQKGGNLSNCFNNADVISQEDFKEEDEIVQFQPNPSVEKFNCYVKANLHSYIKHLLQQKKNISNIKDPLSNLQFPSFFIRHHFPDLATQYDNNEFESLQESDDEDEEEQPSADEDEDDEDSDDELIANEKFYEFKDKLDDIDLEEDESSWEDLSDELENDLNDLYDLNNNQKILLADKFLEYIDDEITSENKKNYLHNIFQNIKNDAEEIFGGKIIHRKKSKTSKKSRKSKKTKTSKKSRRSKKQFLFNPKDPKKSFDVYIDKDPSDTITIKYKTIQDVKNTIKKLEKLYKSNKYSHKRIWQVAMIMKVRLGAIKKHQKKLFPNAKHVKERYELASKYLKFLSQRTKTKKNNRKKLAFIS